MRGALFGGFDETIDVEASLLYRGLLLGCGLRFSTETFWVEELEVGVFLGSMSSFPVAGAWEIALVFAVLESGVLYPPLCSLPDSEIFPPYVVEFTGACSVLFCFLGDLVNCVAAAEVVAIVKTSASSS